ncbi:MAG: PQQ-binding-like beta-propeller repeat protein [Polyangiaceae bacterium]
MRRRVLTLAVGALALLGCDALKAAAVPDNPLWMHHPGGALSVFERRVLTNPNRLEGEPYERGQAEIDWRHLRLFVGSSDRGLYCLNAQNLDVLWRFETRGPVQGEPLYVDDEDAVYFGSTDGALYKVAAKDGALLWRFNSNSEVAKRPVLDGDTLYVTNANDTLIAIERTTGKLKWHQHRTPAFGIQISGYAGPAISHEPGFEGKIFTAYSDGTAMAYSTTDGAEAWPVVDLALAAPGATEGEPPQYLDVDTTPVLTTTKAGPAVIVASYAAGVFALKPEGGSELWHNADIRGVTELTLFEQPAPKEEMKVGAMLVKARHILVASSGSTGLWGIDVDTGQQLWRKKLPEGGMSGAVQVQGALLVSTSRYGLFLFSPLDGNVIDGIAPGNEISMRPAARGSKAFVMTNAGELMSLLVSPPYISKPQKLPEPEKTPEPEKKPEPEPEKK